MKTDNEVMTIMLEKGIDDVGLLSEIRELIATYKLSIEGTDSDRDLYKKFPFLFEFRAKIYDAIDEAG